MSERIELPGGCFISIEGDYAYLMKQDFTHVVTLEEYGTQNNHKTAREFATAMNAHRKLLEQARETIRFNLVQAKYASGKGYVEAVIEIRKVADNLEQALAAIDAGLGGE